MPLTTAQLATVKADIAANSDLNTKPNNSDGAFAIAALYNTQASPDYWVWKSFVADRDIYEATVDATSWSWTTFIARSQGERDAWRQMVNMAGGINPSLVNVRTGIADIFSGAGGLAQRNFLLALGRRLSTRIEKLLASGAGTTAAPSTMGFDGVISYQEVERARNS